MDGYRFDRMYLAPSAKRTPTVLREGFRVQLAARKHELLHVHGEIAGIVCFPALALRPSMVTLHGLNLVRRLHGRRRSAAEANLRLLVRAASRTISVSEEEYEDVLRVVGPRAAERVVVVHNGAEAVQSADAEERAALRAELELPAPVVAGAMIGGLEQHKDPLVPVQAASDVAREGAPLALLVVGSGPLRDELDQRADAAPDGAIRMLGFRADADRILAAADFFALPSLREGLSFALLDAMAHGLACVVSDAPGNVEALDDAGIIVQRGDVAGFRDAFRRLLDSGERLRLGARARERATRHFSVEEMVRRTKDLYDEVLRTRSKSVAA